MGMVIGMGDLDGDLDDDEDDENQDSQIFLDSIPDDLPIKKA